MIFDLIKSWNWSFHQNIKIVSLKFSHFFKKRITKIFCKKLQKIKFAKNSSSFCFLSKNSFLQKNAKFRKKFAIRKICHFLAKNEQGKDDSNWGDKEKYFNVR